VRDRLYGFAAALEPLLTAPDAASFEATWERERLAELGWEALGRARRADTAALEPALAALDRRLLAVLERCRAFPDQHLITFRVPARALAAPRRRPSSPPVGAWRACAP
jgi:hypothetical protein